MNEPIIKLTRESYFSDLADIPTNSFREIGKNILGELDTATSFMYLFRRFGAPTFTNDDEYKILYEYRLQYKEIMVGIHASYYEHVYFNAWMPKIYETARNKEYKEHELKLIKESFEKGIYYMPYAGSLRSPYPEDMNEEANKLYDTEARKFFSIDEYDFLNNFTLNENDFNFNKPFYDGIGKLNTYLCKKFRATLSAEDLQMFNDGWHINNYPEIKKQVEEFFVELLQGRYVRDVQINIRGYESDTNVIECKEEDNE